MPRLWERKMKETKKTTPKKKNKRGGKAQKKEPKPKAEAESCILISRDQRNKRKFITVIKGVESCGLKPKDVSKLISKKFACSASVVKGTDGGAPSISIQGDIHELVPQFLVDSCKVDKGAVYYAKKGGTKSKVFKP